jgi:hypothetical protein
MADCGHSFDDCRAVGSGLCCLADNHGYGRGDYMIVPVCQGINCLALMWAGFTAQLQPPPLQEMPLGLTNYWFFDENGRPVAWNGQANGQPDYYANMYPTDAAHNWHVAGCIQDWTKIYHGQGSMTTAVSF